MLRIKIVFSECEHSGDLENYLEDIEDKGLFLAQFKTTDSFGFQT